MSGTVIVTNLVTFNILPAIFFSFLGFAKPSQLNSKILPMSDKRQFLNLSQSAPPPNYAGCPAPHPQQRFWPVRGMGPCARELKSLLRYG